MNELSGDNFEYLLQLTKVLANECRQTRQETDKIELLFKRVAKQSAISYEDLSAKVPTETLESYEKLSTPNTIDQLINENYALLYKIEQRDYINAKIFALINNINDHLASIKNFVIEQKFTREQDLENFVYENIEAKRNIVNANMENLKKKKP
ncbi:Far3p KNAG_0F02770 [Huiozyma naganishii CBS 8797]|uniref:Uncharacterized protein n=1 Tax=Huiozyma naganishii (strain ATCC MYA-139 / BCRC 22969 / CBS 8797 / KCTC 17520 / NBRC 10181 / NCYC 3082 / Yp74L-3) TaxID=1071383 RepID=J7S7E6_HUIN7|nr:hypothetical protein KNAG_0F02770 [Kazachstania naganishii CBS 8797]CCK70939.1 hypothetical protein KNAG_0F02770 [Kazachstania naganishii CBS 8797]